MFYTNGYITINIYVGTIGIYVGISLQGGVKVILKLSNNNSVPSSGFQSHDLKAKLL